ncbi:MAG TPA: ATP-binding protein [Candidatus Acidoferrum sp.]|nr:ATP-binding protein [Candidatus Acidoferrum sp.]
MGVPSVRPDSWKAFAVASGAAALASIAFVAVIALQLGGHTFVVAVDDIGESAAALIAAGVCVRTARRSDGQFRRGWALLGASAASWGLGQAVWSFYEVGFGITPFPSAADAGYLAAVPLAILGVLSFWTAPRGTAERWRVWLDGLNIFLALVFTAWALGLQQVNQGGGSLVERAISLAYPVGDILVATVLILGIRRATRFQHGRMLLLLLGLAANSLSDTAFAYMTADGNYLLVLDSGWVIGYLLVALAALWPARADDRAADRLPIDLWQIALPWAVVVAAATSALIVVVRGGRTDQFQYELAVAMAALLIVSEVLTHIDSLGMLVSSRQSEALLAEVIAQAPIGIARTDKRMKVIDANPETAVLFREPLESMIGSAITKYIPAADPGGVLEKLRALQNSGTDGVQADSPMVRADGSEVWVHWTSTAVRDATGELEYFLTTLEDITAMHQAEESGKANLMMLERLNLLKSEFLQGVSFEFRTALMEINGSSELIRDGHNMGAAETKALATEIYNNGDRLDRLITEMLELDRIETSRGSLMIEPVDLNGIIARETGKVKHNMSGALFVLHLDPSLPAVAGDASKLAEVVHTLLAYALRYSPYGSEIVVTTGVRGAQVEVSVQDQGLGVRADFDNRIFGDGDAYTNHPIRKVVGTGLGLGLARQIVEMHDGQIGVDHLEGAGSVSHFTLPALGANRPPAIDLGAALDAVHAGLAGAAIG